MKQLINEMSVQCKKCGEIFDLNYDLKGLSEERLIYELLKGKHRDKKMLCWKCRQESE